MPHSSEHVALPFTEEQNNDLKATDKKQKQTPALLSVLLSKAFSPLDPSRVVCMLVPKMLYRLPLYVEMLLPNHTTLVMKCILHINTGVKVCKSDSYTNILSRRQHSDIFIIWQQFLLFKGNKFTAGLIVKKHQRYCHSILKLDQRNVEEMSMNIANLSLENVGEKAQGVNSVLITIVNQQEDKEKGA